LICKNGFLRANITPKTKPEMSDGMRSQFPANHINDSMFIIGLSNVPQLHIEVYNNISYLLLFAQQ